MTRVRVLVVDDSAFARKVLRSILEDAPDVEVVGTARDGLEALERIAETSPDVITLDLAMPNLDGLGVLRALAGRTAPRVVVVSIAGSDSEQGVAALSLGAVEVVHKPTALATDRLYEVSGDLLHAVRTAASARAPGPDALAVATPAVVARRASKRVILIGASTGGPHAVSRVLRALPADLPVPVAVVLHLPRGYTGPYAARLDGECQLQVREAEHGMALLPGMAVVARAGFHLKIRAAGRSLSIATDVAPANTPHRPSVDVLFASAAEAVGAAALGVVLTGMGDDGLVGSRRIREAGGVVLTETESSCVVYGMPRSVWEAGLSDAAAPLSRMADEIVARL